MREAAPTRRRLDAAGLWWGLVLCLLTGLVLWRATGHPVDRKQLTDAAPFVLIGLGVLRLVLGAVARRRG
ncbi:MULTISPECIES: hypothetical protein [unclassified Luteococcus]|uniref:hypothetical protein n=1 Tax=unclassified Luteococcus TaxID=2639923 RepID=UPI00313EA358